MRFSKNIRTTVTISNATPAVFTCTDHELAVGDQIRLETTDTLPTGLTASDGDSEQIYYVIQNAYTASQFCVSDSKGGEAINTTGAGTGTHYFIKLNRARFSPNVEDCR